MLQPQPRTTCHCREASNKCSQSETAGMIQQESGPTDRIMKCTVSMQKCCTQEFSSNNTRVRRYEHT
jgi:hypothetical protein